MIEGVFIIDKPEGPTSFDVVRQVKKVFPKEKLGHGGSLDPFATGVLILLLGRATKHSSALLNADKRYWAKAKLGEATYTMDRTGEVFETKPVPALTFAAVEQVLNGFVGEWMQTAPMFSAKKVHGVRLYDLARQQIHVRRAPEPVTIHGVKLLSVVGAEVEFELHCSKGTYVRAFADEFARRLGTVGHLHSLRRITCGEFNLEDSISPVTLCTDPEKWMDWGRKNFHTLLRGGRTLFPPPGPSRSVSSFANTH